MYYIAKTWRVSCADSKNSFLKFHHKKKFTAKCVLFWSLFFSFFLQVFSFFASFRFLLKFQLMKENTPLSDLYFQKLANIFSKKSLILRFEYNQNLKFHQKMTWMNHISKILWKICNQKFIFHKFRKKNSIINKLWN